MIIEVTNPLHSMAYHEAGHAVMSVPSRVAVEHVTIVSDEEADTLGHCRNTGNAWAAQVLNG